MHIFSNWLWNEYQRSWCRFGYDVYGYDVYDYDVHIKLFFVSVKSLVTSVVTSVNWFVVKVENDRIRSKISEKMKNRISSQTT